LQFLCQIVLLMSQKKSHQQFLHDVTKKKMLNSTSTEIEVQC